MCLAIPGQVVSLVPEQADLVKVDVAGVRRNVNVGLFDAGTIGVGDWLLIHVGFALSKISEVEAHDQLRMLGALGEDMLALEEVRGYTFALDEAERS